MANYWAHPFTSNGDEESGDKVTTREKQVTGSSSSSDECMDNDPATLERERARLQRELQALDVRVVIESVQHELAGDSFVLSPEAYAIRQRISDVVLARENALQYTLCEVRVQRPRAGWPKAQLPWSTVLAIRRRALKRTRYPLGVFVLAKLALLLWVAYLLYFLYRLHAVK